MIDYKKFLIIILILIVGCIKFDHCGYCPDNYIFVNTDRGVCTKLLVNKILSIKPINNKSIILYQDNIRPIIIFSNEPTYEIQNKIKENN